MENILFCTENGTFTNYLWFAVIIISGLMSVNILSLVCENNCSKKLAFIETTSRLFEKFEGCRE